MQGEFGGKQKAALGVLLRGAGEAGEAVSLKYRERKEYWKARKLESKRKSKAFLAYLKRIPKTHTKSDQRERKGRAKRAREASEASEPKSDFYFILFPSNILTIPDFFFLQCLK